AITQMDQVTQQNAALVEEAAAAAASLQDQAGSLSQVVGVFKLGSDTTAMSTMSAMSHRVPVRAEAPVHRARVTKRVSPAPRAAAAPRELTTTAAAGDGWETF
ncbi:methyl-accepting chemotaxis protein, partial [Variovorax sp. J2R1-6]|nr:methyl-accepting chemotaxis protein [Variovorax sp. J2R1-6]